MTHTLKVYVGTEQPKEFLIEPGQEKIQVPLALSMVTIPEGVPIITTVQRTVMSNLMEKGLINYTLPKGMGLFYEGYEEVAICYLAAGFEELGGDIRSTIHISEGSGSVLHVFLEDATQDIIKALNTPGAFGRLEEVLARRQQEEERKANHD